MWVVISTDNCVYCTKAEELLKDNNISFTEYNVSSGSSRWMLNLLKLASIKTVPQIFNMAGTHIGGYTELKDYLQ